jgi:hypothetical protein
MENLIDFNYFQVSLYLPYVNLQSGTGGSAAGINKHKEQLDRQIAIYQKEFLTLLFGSEVIPEEVAAMVVDDILFVSPIANYVYCKVLPDYASRSTASGEKVKGAEASETADHYGKVCNAWNQMVYMNAIIRETLDKAGKDATYPTDYNNPIYKLKSFI